VSSKKSKPFFHNSYFLFSSHPLLPDRFPSHPKPAHAYSPIPSARSPPSIPLIPVEVERSETRGTREEV
jgi:hypothetical protein